jgi:hypothetical protein
MPLFIRGIDKSICFYKKYFFHPVEKIGISQVKTYKNRVIYPPVKYSLAFFKVLLKIIAKKLAHI